MATDSILIPIIDKITQTFSYLHLVICIVTECTNNKIKVGVWSQQLRDSKSIVYNRCIVKSCANKQGSTINRSVSCCSPNCNEFLLYDVTSQATSQLFNINNVTTDYKKGFGGKKLWSYIFDLLESHFFFFGREIVMFHFETL